MLRLANDRNEQAALRSVARKQAERFDWKGSARKMLQLYEEAIASPKRSAMRGVVQSPSNSPPGKK
jgi:alpha-1,3-rhamnosyl/mannosyltransferase